MTHAVAYLAVQNGDTNLMAETVAQCGLQRDVLKTSQYNNWQHIIGPQSQDTGLWSTGNGWAGYGMVRVVGVLDRSLRTTSGLTQISAPYVAEVARIVIHDLASRVTQRMDPGDP
jgi:rhamnogalacturonyl hydrolase YesR